MSRDDRRGRLRILLGAAPGVGTTSAMLDEGRRLFERGADVVVGAVEAHDRPRTAERVRGLEIVPSRSRALDGGLVEEMDVDAVLRRAPSVVLVDELAHRNAPGGRHGERWRDVEDLRDAGIDVLSTLDIGQVASLNDVVTRITGVGSPDTVPDLLVRTADEVELVDLTPEALRRRIAEGDVYAADGIDVTLANVFREDNVAALRELALLWLADRVDDALEAHRDQRRLTPRWEARERVVVAVTGAPGNDRLIRRAARLAHRAHGDLIGVHVIDGRGRAAVNGHVVPAHRQLLEEVGGELRQVTAADVGDALLEVARAEHGTQIVLGASRRSRWDRLLRGSVVTRVVDRAGPIDVHVISDDREGPGRPLGPTPTRLSPLSARRRGWGWGLAVGGVPLLTLLLANLRAEIHLPTVLLLFLIQAMLVAVVGGALPALLAAVGGLLAADYYFTRPLYGLSVAEPEEVIALVVYLGAATIVSVLVDRVARLRLAVRRVTAEAEAMAALAGSLTGPEALPGMLAHLRSTFAMSGAALFRVTDGHWAVEVADGAPPARVEDADVQRAVGPDRVLTLSGRPLDAADQGVLTALAGQLATAVEARRLQDEADRAAELAVANDFRASLLQAVSHDLRTPLAGIKASISSLRATEVEWSDVDVADFERTIEEETDRLDALVASLLDMGRIQAGAVTVERREVALEEVVPSVLTGLGARAGDVEVEVPETLPVVLADPVLLERVLANLVENALKVTPAGMVVRLQAGQVPGGVDLRCVDRGPGIAESDRERVFEPFQRTTDHGTGVGLGLAIARGFVEAMGARLSIDDTPGGGATMVVHLPVLGDDR